MRPQSVSEEFSGGSLFSIEIQSDHMMKVSAFKPSNYFDLIALLGGVLTLTTKFCCWGLRGY